MFFSGLIDEMAGSLRRMRRRAWNTVHLTLILAIGFGCVIGMFDVAYGILDTPLPSQHSERIVVAGSTYTRRMMFEYDQANPRLDAVFEKAAEYKLIDANLDLPNQTARLRVAMVSLQFFATLGVEMFRGHDFSRSNVPGDGRVQQDWLPMVVSHELWRTYFGASDSAVNRSVELTVQPFRYQIIGVLPAGASFPADVDAWIPVHLVSYSMIQTAGVPSGTGGVIALLKAGVPLQTAESAIRNWPKDRFFDGGGAEDAVKLISLRDFWAGEIQPLSLNLWLVSIFFLSLIIVAAATILQTEADIRRHEFAIKSALGASAGRLLRALSVEIALVLLLALGVGFAIRTLVIHVTGAWLALPPGFSSAVRAVDLLMALGVGVLTFVVALAIQGFRLLNAPSAPASERMGAQFVKGRRQPRSLMRYRIPLQMVPAAMIIIVAGLFVRSAYNTLRIDPGVQTGNVFVSGVSLSHALERFVAGLMTANMSPDERSEVYIQGSRRFYEMMHTEIRQIVDVLSKSPGIVHAGVISTAPYRGHRPFAWEIRASRSPGVPPDAAVIRSVIFRSMTNGAMPALGMRLLYGRAFTGISAEDENTVLVNESLAERLGGGSAALGQYIRLAQLSPARIIGVVANVREENLYSPAWPTAYLPLSQWAFPDVDLVVRASPGLAGRDVLPLVRDAVRSASNRAMVSRFERLTTMVESAGTLTRYAGYYLLALAVLSVVLAGFCASSRTIGEFYRRRDEIGIRLALGALPSGIVRLFVCSDLWRNAVAALLGALVAWWFASLLRHWLHGVAPFDPLSYVVGIGALIGSIAAVQIVLLWRALRKDPRELLM